MLRDNPGLERIGMKTRFVFVNMVTGKIIGSSSFSNGTYSNVMQTCMSEKPKDIEMFTLPEYLWFTDRHRKTKVVTAADFYKSGEYKKFIEAVKKMRTG